MRNLLIAGAVMLGFCTSQAQGTLEFHTFLHGANALPPNTAGYDGSGMFTLDANDFFTGQVYVQIGFAGMVRIYNSSQPDSLGTPVFDFVAGGVVAPDGFGDPGGRQYTVSRTLDAAERSDLLAGNWWAVYVQNDFPDGASRGLVVPEPSTWTMLFAGNVIWALFRLGLRRSAKQHL